MIHDARYWQNHFRAGLLYAGRIGGEDEWLGTNEKWNELLWLEDGVKDKDEL